MLLSIDMLSEVPIYEQLCHQIIEAIAKGQLNEGDELPSVRSLASDIGVNLHTINKAYNQLKQKNFLIVNRRRGVVVNAQDQYKSDEAYLKALKDNLKSYVVESMARAMSYDELERVFKEIYSEVKGE